MEDIIINTEEIFLHITAVEKQWIAKFEAAKIKLNNIVHGLEENESTPQKHKKKIKRLSVITDACETSNISSAEKLVNAAQDNNTTHDVPPTPADVSKLENQSTRENDVTCNETISTRPSRAAKSKAEQNLKEPLLIGKMRRDTPNGVVTRPLQIVIKKEKLSEGKITVKNNTSDNGKDQNEGQPTKRKSDSIEEEDASSGDANKEESIKKRDDDSLLIVPNGDTGIIPILSDDDSAEKMPPPQALPKKKKGQKLQQLEEVTSQRSTRSRIKEEKHSLENSNDKMKSNSNNNTTEELKANSENLLKEVKTEKEFDQDIESVTSRTSKKGKKGKKAFKHKPIKEEKRDSEVEKANTTEVFSSDQLLKETETEKENNPETEDVPETENNTVNKENKNTSFESVYEDAVAGEIAKESEININKKKLNPVVMLTKIPLATVQSEVGKFSLEKGNATFVSAKDVTVTTSINNETFVASSQQTTFVVDKQMANEEKSKMPNDATFCMNSTITKPSENDKLISSLITEDESYEESLPNEPVNLKLKNQLFNPFVQSPVKKKVEAFEKRANQVASPFQQRQTRTTTKAKQTKENKEPENNYSQKSLTPLSNSHLNRLLTPVQQSYLTPGNQNNSMIKKFSSSTSKLMQMTKTSTKLAPTSKTPSLSRENSVEEFKKGLNKLQQLADERRRKREQKQQLAAQTREARDKQRAEKLKKAMQEREEKAKRKAMEAEQKKHLEDINRNLKQQEEKREAQKRLEKQRQLEQEKLEAARREREMIENMKILRAKEVLQQQKLENIRLLKLKQMKEKSKANYNFDMLHTDDSTDDEEKPSTKRPPPPSWSKAAVRKIFLERQAHLNPKLIDSFFSVQPMTPDLRDIFPKIDARYLKRNSSMVWKTPPRYSQLPKY